MASMVRSTPRSRAHLYVASLPRCHNVSWAHQATDNSPLHCQSRSLQKSRWVLLPCTDGPLSLLPVPDGIRVHCAPVSTKAFSCGSHVPGHRIHTVRQSWLSLSSAWPETGTLSSWLEYSLSESCGLRPEVPLPRPGGEMFSAFLLHMGHCWLSSTILVATGVSAFLDRCFLAVVFLAVHICGLLDLRWAHCPTSSCPPPGRTGGTPGWHGVHLAPPFPLAG